MTSAGIIRGVVAQIRWAYYDAATVDGYTVVRHLAGPGRPPSWSVSARIVTSDKFKMAQRPLIFVAPHAKGRWVWPIKDYLILDGTLTADLGPVEEY